jgi:hypothetical protein
METRMQGLKQIPKHPDKQQLFDRVWLTYARDRGKLAFEWRPKKDGSGLKTRGLYNRDDGDSCGVGHLIPGDCWSPSMERQGFAAIWRDHQVIRDYFGVDNYQFLFSLQHAHDWSIELEAIYHGRKKFKHKRARKDFLAQLRQLATSQHLNIPNDSQERQTDRSSPPSPQPQHEPCRVQGDLC